MALGVLGVALFSQTFPATRVAVAEMSPLMVGFGRAVLAAACGGLALWLSRAAWPTRREALQLVLVGLCVALGFPYFSAVAMQTVSAAHGGVMLGLLPLVTVIAGVIVNRERPSLAFWATAAAGSASVVVFALSGGRRGAEAGGPLSGGRDGLRRHRLCRRGPAGPSPGRLAGDFLGPGGDGPLHPAAGPVEPGQRQRRHLARGLGRVSLCRPGQPADRLFRLVPGPGAGRRRPGQPDPALQPFLTLVGAALLIGERLDR